MNFDVILWETIDFEEDIESVVEVLRSDFLTQGQLFLSLKGPLPPTVAQTMQLRLTVLHQHYILVYSR